MKLLLTIIMTTLMSASAFAECSPTKLSECKDQSSCERISTRGGKEYVFQNKICMVKDTAVATDCSQVLNSGLPKDITTDTTGAANGNKTGTR